MTPADWSCSPLCSPTIIGLTSSKICVSPVLIEASFVPIALPSIKVYGCGLSLLHKLVEWEAALSLYLPKSSCLRVFHLSSCPYPPLAIISNLGYGNKTVSHPPAPSILYSKARTNFSNVNPSMHPPPASSPSLNLESFSGFELTQLLFGIKSKVLTMVPKASLAV